MVLFYGCKGSIFFAFMQIVIVFFLYLYASSFQNRSIISIQKLITIAEAKLIDKVKSTFIRVSF